MAGPVWSPELECRLFENLLKQKPCGVPDKHFHMLCLVELMQQDKGHSLTADELWAHLNTLYDMKALDENEGCAFPNAENEFFLPHDEEFSKLQEGKQDTSERNLPGKDTIPMRKTTPSSASKRSRKNSDGGNSSRSSTPALGRKDARKS